MSQSGKTPEGQGLETEKLWDDGAGTHRIQIAPIVTAGEEVLPCLILISGRQMGQVFRLTAKDARIGRAEDADLCIRDDSISRFHAVVYLDPHSRCRIRDLGSTNGTFVNGKRIQDSELGAGDRVQLGRATILKLEYHGKAENEFHNQLYEAGTRDPLTDVFNRRYLDQHLESDFSLAIRHQEDLSVLLLDIDHFKIVNDTHGHLAGDAVLRNLAQVLSSRTRTEDILARYGGEEFVLVLPRTAPAGARVLAEDLRKLVEEAVFLHKEIAIHVTVSIGVAGLTHPPGLKTPQELLGSADQALYRAKSKGRNRVEEW